jgi:plasmid stability protein
MIQIRHVPDDIHKTLKIRAIKKGMSLSNYLLQEVTQIAKRPTLEDFLADIEQSPSLKITESSADAVRAERETM